MNKVSDIVDFTSWHEFFFLFMVFSVFAGCQIPYPKREFLNEDEPEEKGDKVYTALRNG